MPGNSPLSHDPRRSAKQLHKAALAGDAVALGRLRLVYDDLATSAAPPASALSLRRCQHVIARESGFDSWKDLVGSEAKPTPKQSFLVIDEFWSTMNSVQEQQIPTLRSMRGVPDETYRIRDDGRIYCAQALAHAVSASGEALTQELIDRLLPDMWRPAAEAVQRWGVPTTPYTLVGLRGAGPMGAELVDEDEPTVRIRHDLFNAFLPGRYRRAQAYEIAGQLVIGRYQASMPDICTWRGIPLEPIDDLDWRHLGAPPIPIDLAADVDPPARIQPENPLLGSDGQRALAIHHQAWKRALRPFIHRAIRVHETDGTRLNGLPWDRLGGETDPTCDEDAAEVRSLARLYIPPAIPNHILAGYQHDFTHGHVDDDMLIWGIIGHHLIGCTVLVGLDASVATGARFAVARWLEGLPWDAAAAEARTVEAYDRRLLAIVKRVDQANDFIAGAHPQPPRVGPPWRTMHENFEAMVRVCRHVGVGKPLMCTQSAVDFEQRGVSVSREH